jgi:hypothetical protein
MNEQTMNIVKQLKDKLMLAESTDEIRDIITKAGGEITAEDAEHIMTEIKRTNAPSGTDIDDDEMDAVAGGLEWCSEAFTCLLFSFWGTR